MVFVHFPAGEVDKQFKLNMRTLGVRHVLLKTIMYRGVDQSVLMMRLDEMVMAVETENLTGYPVPIFQTGATDGGTNFEVPLLLAHCNKPSIQTVRIRLSSIDGSSVAGHQGVSLWLLLEKQRETYDLESVRLAQWLQPNTAMSGAGQNDTRWDYVPGEQETAGLLEKLGDRFSNLTDGNK